MEKSIIILLRNPKFLISLMFCIELSKTSIANGFAYEVINSLNCILDNIELPERT